MPFLYVLFCLILILQYLMSLCQNLSIMSSYIVLFFICLCTLVCFMVLLNLELLTPLWVNVIILFFDCSKESPMWQRPAKRFTCSVRILSVPSWYLGISHLVAAICLKVEIFHPAKWSWIQGPALFAQWLLGSRWDRQRRRLTLS